ncbi:MAG TPA: VOC family protein, partial [Gammaproteobacteria bacterium]
GTRIELLETPDFRGIQHVHLVTEDPTALTNWFLEVFGGDFDSELGGEPLNAIQYDGIWVYISVPPAETPESDASVLALEPFGALDESVLAVESFATTEAEAREDMAAILPKVSPSRGRSLDHFGFAVDDMDEIVARVRGTGYEPYVVRPNRPGGTTLLMFFEGAGGIHFEIAEPNGVEPSGQR